jgi:ABC-type transporter Mla maintaining outer membrane lipid asymmetry ATPase subunit MlaF
VIELRGVKKRFGAQVILDGVDFDVREGETVALLGPSGTGKSVLLKTIIGLITPDAGQVIVDGKDVPRLKRGELSWQRLPGEGSVGRGEVTVTFDNGTTFASGRTVFGSFEARIP